MYFSYSVVTLVADKLKTCMCGRNKGHLTTIPLFCGYLEAEETQCSCYACVLGTKVTLQPYLYSVVADKLKT